MSKFTFIHESGETKLEMSFEAESYADVLEEFTHFLRGCGFFIDGDLEIVGEDEYITDKPESVE